MFSGYLAGFLALLLFTSFVKIVTTLSILRFGMGLHGAGLGVAIFALGFALTLLVVSPHIEAAGGLQRVLDGKGGFDRLSQQFHPFLKKNVDSSILKRFTAIATKLHTPDRGAESQKSEDEVSFPVLLSAFLVSELQTAFQIGFIVLIPFLVIDLLVVNVLMSLSIVQISQAVVAVPLKILLFFVLDGWLLISERLLGGYA